jgi:hypothetical protein
MAKDKRPVKEYELVANPWQKPVKIEVDPTLGPRGKATVKREKPAAEAAEPKPEKPKIPDEQFIAALKAIGHPASSREISDALGIENADFGRALVRREMEKLIKEGKVVAVESEKKNIGKLYKLP